MDSSVLLEKLLDIERAIGKKDTETLRGMVIEAELYVLEMKKSVETSRRRESLWARIGF